MALYKFRIIIIIIIIIITNNSSLTPRLSFCYLYWRLHFWWHLTFFLIIPDSVQNVYRKIVFLGVSGLFMSLSSSRTTRYDIQH